MMQHQKTSSRNVVMQGAETAGKSASGQNVELEDEVDLKYRLDGKHYQVYAQSKQLVHDSNA